MASQLEDFAQAASDWDLDRLYIDLASAKQEFAPHKKRGLTEVEKLHLRGLLCEYSPAEVAAKLFKRAKGVEVDLCNTLYRYAEALTKRPVNSLENWRDIVTWLEAQGYRRGPGGQGGDSQSKITPFATTAETPATQLLQNQTDWGEAPDVSVFYGRTEELEVLQRWIVKDHCRLIVLLGMGGIGKTALSVRSAELLQDKFDYLIWRSLRYAPPIEEILAEIIRFLSNEAETNLPQDVGRLVSLLIKYLRSHRCLLILDEAHTILRSGALAGQYREGYEGYSELLKRIGEQQHNSCLVLTSQEKPKDVSSQEGDKRPVRSLQLQGLKEAEAREIFAAKGLADPERWGSLIQIYRGNPLFLNIIAASIKDAFNGNVVEFLKLNTIVVGDISPLIDPLFERLSTREKEIMYQLANRENPVLISILQEILAPVSYSELMEALESLGRRSLIEKHIEGTEFLYTLQPVVRKYLKRKSR